ncbi:MAG: NifB/NifX family molybdenum-iron cluster-binding protein [Chloroflexota bacterium]
MKVAVITDDQQTVSQHFGRAQYYRVFSIENGKITASESRAKANHNHFSDGSIHQHHSEPHGTDPASEQRHASMLDTISDCQVVLVRGMGMGAHNAFKARGIDSLITDIADVQQAVEAYLNGSIVDHPEKLH